ncbi:MAG TPA: hypothetical protein VJA21_09790 [Verrucomicrobiae bacterium]
MKVSVMIIELVEMANGVRSPPESVSGERGAAQVGATGKRLFHDPQVGCAVCHAPPLFTDWRRHEVGTERGKEAKGLPGRMPAIPGFDTPAPVECCRTAPYLHDGSAATMREVLTTRNAGDRHGRTSHLTARQLADLAAYVLSL